MLAAAADGELNMTAEGEQFLAKMCGDEPETLDRLRSRIFDAKRQMLFGAMDFESALHELAGVTPRQVSPNLAVIFDSLRSLRHRPAQ